MKNTPQSTIVLKLDETVLEHTSTGSGPVDASFKAIENIVHSDTNLLLYSVNAITAGTEAQGQVTVRLEKDGTIVNGTGIDTDILIASVKAYIHSLNLIHKTI